jgi:hypothetical protein
MYYSSNEDSLVILLNTYQILENQKNIRRQMGYKLVYLSENEKKIPFIFIKL